MRFAAPLKNVSAFVGMLERLQTAPLHLPRIGVYYGWSGLGKTRSAIYGANKVKAAYVEARSCWTGKTFLAAVLGELIDDGRALPKTVSGMVEAASERLLTQRKVLVIDEADKLVDRGYVELIRDLYEASQRPIVLIGEEQLPDKLKRNERVHNRVLEWVPAQALDWEDGCHLRALYCQGVQPDDALLRAALEKAPAARRLVVNLDRFQEHGLTLGLDVIGLKEWGDRDFYTGEAPARRTGGKR